MRKIVFDAWADELAAGMARHFPLFSIYRKKPTVEEQRRAFFGRKTKIYAWTPEDGICLFIAFRPIDEGFDAFVGWSKNGRFPYGDEDIFRSDGEARYDLSVDYFISMPLIIANRQGMTFWKFWDFPVDEGAELNAEFAAQFAAAYANHFTQKLNEEDARLLVRPAITQAIELIEMEVTPYFTKIIEMYRSLP